MGFVQRIRIALSGTSTAAVLRRVGVAQLGLWLHERRSVREGQYTLTYRGLVRTFAVRERADVRSVDYFVVTEGPFLDRIRAALGPGDVLLDVGANLGLMSLLSAGPGVTVHAFEPNPVMAARARENVALNPGTDVTVHEVALGREPGEAQLGLGQAGADECPSMARKLPGERIVVGVERADDMAARLGVRPAAVKIDVEGFEMDVLLGMGGLLRDAVRDLFIEIHPRFLEEVGHSADGLRAWLAARGFHRVWSAPGGRELHEQFRRER